MAHGCDGLMYFRYRGATKGAEQFCYGILDADNVPRRRFFEVQSFFREVREYQDVLTAPVHSDVAILYDYDSLASFRIQQQSLLLDCETEMKRLHGVFFRDSKLMNYWGRIPAELEANGAVIFYGEQQSAASVEDSAAELAERIEQLVQKTGCGKVNIIAHSKGGLDSRYAISKLGSDKYVASLTTINTPHHGCLFAEYLLNTAPEKFVKSVEKIYNSAFKRLGDPNPDFLAAVTDLTNSRCEQFDQDTPGVMYQSVGSHARCSKSGRFPLNLSYPIVKKYDGDNDGLVALTSAPWGEDFTVLHPTGKRGITHADVIDLNRENIPGFDVREFYVQLVNKLKMRGF